jgi:hypothetical protein
MRFLARPLPMRGPRRPSGRRCCSAAASPSAWIAACRHGNSIKKSLTRLRLRCILCNRFLKQRIAFQ